MAYSPDIVVGVWVGNTATNGGGGTIRAFGESVGQTIMRRFVNALPRSMRDWYSTPSGIVHGACDSQEIFLSGTQGGPCPSPSPCPSSSPSASPSASPGPSPSACASSSPSASPSASPTGRPTLSPSPSPQPSPPPPASPPPGPTPT